MICWQTASLRRLISAYLPSARDSDLFDRRPEIIFVSRGGGPTDRTPAPRTEGSPGQLALTRVYYFPRLRVRARTTGIDADEGYPGMANTDIRIRGAREHNLRDVSLDLPRGALICFTGVSGS